MSAEPDILDQASELTQTLTDAYVSNVRDAAVAEQVRRPDGTWPFPECVDCGDDIPAERLELGKKRCVCCQSDREREQASRGRG